ncbi:MAG: heme biosynthesis protein HemY [Betaproteobacteria bacterium]|nr:heme biosynthesis protein HemY [Betaproteobacteria bacterium]
MKILLWFLLLAALAIALALVGQFNEAYLLLVVPPYRMEISLNLTIILIVCALCLIYLASHTATLVLSLSRRARQYREQHHREQSAAAFHNALRFLFEGRFGHALKQAATAHEAGQSPGLSALIAARAAQRLREPGKQEIWLNRAGESDPGIKAARLMCEAELHLETRQFDSAIAALGRLQEIAGRHIAALRLELRAQQGLGNWDEVLRLTRLLEKRKALKPEAAREIRIKAHRENLRRFSSDAQDLLAYFGKIPAAEQGPKLCTRVAELLLALGAHDEARSLLESALERHWEPELLRLYGLAEGGDMLARIARAERWQTQNPREPELSLALGRLCMRQRLWGKAKHYFETALATREQAETLREAHFELARLADELERPEEANRHYRESAALGHERKSS